MAEMEKMPERGAAQAESIPPYEEDDDDFEIVIAPTKVRPKKSLPPTR